MKIVLSRASSNVHSAFGDLLQCSLVVLALGFAVGSADGAQSVTLAWDPSPDASVAGYYLRYGTASQTYSAALDSGPATTDTISGLAAGQTYYIVVTAYTAQGLESEPSTEVAYTVPALAPCILRIVLGRKRRDGPRLQFLVPPDQAYEVHSSGDLRSWVSIFTGISRSTNWIEFVDPQAIYLPKRFYRIAH